MNSKPEVKRCPNFGPETLTALKVFKLIFNFDGNCPGRTFYVKVNDVAVYLKGSNWIPADVLPESASLDYVEELLTACKEANMNALRVWGGGLYESDEFYQVWCPRNEWTLPEMLMDGFGFRWPTDWAS
jgi:hypothetical protein